MINFTYHNPTKIVFGKDQLDQLETLLAPYQNKNILLVYGKSSIKKLGIYDRVLKIVQRLNITVYEEANVRANPSMESVYSGRQTCIDENIEFVLAVGGGSVLDAAKAIAFAATLKKEEVWDVFLQKAQATSAIPIGTVLTLAATGSESNGNTVITNDATDEKRSVAYPFLFPVFSIIDPSYTQSVSEHYTIAGCTDIIMHIFEQYFSNTLRTETSDYMSAGIIKSVIENTHRLKTNQDDYETRANISWAATLGLNWILQQGKIGDWATHRLSYPITQRFGTTHGFALTTIFPAWLTIALKYNKETMERRLSFIGKELFNIESPPQVIEQIRAMFKSFGAPTSFEEAGITLDQNSLDLMVDNALALGNVGTVVSIDRSIAKELFSQALT